VALDLQDFFGLLQNCDVIIPSFATQSYVTHRASSTDSTALSASVALAADAGVIQAYSYLNSRTVLMTPNSSDLASVLRGLRRGTTIGEAIQELKEVLFDRNAAAFLPCVVPR
jgi:hypothetical protein